jgi:biopolymer transport protein ExbB
MSSTHVDALARLGTALCLLAAIPGCKFDPVGGVPGDGNTPVDARRPVDARPPDDGRPPIDSIPVTPTDGPPMVEIDAMEEDPLRRKAITIRASQVEAPGGSGDLTDFPVLVAVQDPQIMAGARQNEDNVYFVAADGTTRLAHEIEKWTPGTNEIIAWVKIPRVSEAADTVFYVYYGAPAPGGPVDPAQVWSNGYVAVWHLAEPPGQAGGINDSTNGNDGTAHSSMQANDLVTGKIGDAIDFDGMDDEIEFQNPISGSGPHTISAWVNQQGTGSDDAVVTLGEDAQHRARFLYSVYTNDSIAVGFYANDVVTTTNIIDDDWTLVHWTYTNRDNVLYVNGASLGGAQVGNGVDTRGSEGRLGNATPGNFGPNLNLNGQLDEVRITTAVRPAEWVRTEFNNQSSPSSFYNVGAEERP